MRIAIIGAGIVGITSAYYLTKAGYKVTLFDSESGPAQQSSHANGGQISVSNSEVWNTWHNIYKGIKWLAKKDAPLLIRPSLDWDKTLWLLKFLYYTATNTYERNSIATIKLGLQARKLYEKIIVEEQLKFDQRYEGILHIYRNKNWFKQAKQRQQLYVWNDCDHAILTNKDDILKIEPNLFKIQDIVGASYTKSDWTGDIYQFCNNLFNVLTTKYSVEYEFNRKIRFMYELSTYDKIVVANGSQARHLSRQIGDCHPVYPVKGYSITIPAQGIKNDDAMPTVSILDDENKIVCSKLGTRLRVAGTAEITGDDTTIRSERIEPLVRWVNKNFPDINTERYDSWACLRPMTPNMLPIVKQSKFNAKVFYNIGHGHLGWTLSTATAKKLTDMIDKNNI